MVDEVEKYSRRRRRLMIGMGIAFLAWQLTGMEVVNDFASGDRRAVRYVSLFAFAVWALVLVRLMRLRSMRGASAEARAALDDELVRANRARAFQTGYMVMLGVAAVMFTASLFLTIPGNAAAQVILVSGIVAPMFSFAWLEGKGA